VPNNKDQGQDVIDIPAALGADAGVSPQCFSIYIPNKDQSGQEIGNQRKWVLEAIGLLCEINGGSSAMPPVEGAWRNDDSAIIWENPVVVYSYVRTEAFLQNLPRLREFLHRMGRETNQGEVAFEFAERFYRIRTFDSARRRKP
jgi:hypothetical protein